METESGNILEGEWREENVRATDSSTKSNTPKATKHAQHIIDTFANHFWGPDQTPWQWKMI